MDTKASSNAKATDCTAMATTSGEPLLRDIAS
jgi:hypothetical protein